MNAHPRTPASKKRRLSWALWAALTLGTALGLAHKLRNAETSREVFLPGKTTHGHYQIEFECVVCHKEGFTSAADFQAACLECHGAELREVEDSHPEEKFTDPRNADRVEKLDARFCVTCHSEHQPARTGTMGLSLPGDYCYHCHQEIEDERESHVGLPFDSCANAGCHNFHDNKALYEDYLVKHGQEAALLSQPLREVLSPEPCPSKYRKSLTSTTKFETCKECHDSQTQGWLGGRHGMRAAHGLAPMTVGDARLPMKQSAAHQSMTCASCHENEAAHGPTYSSVESCEKCHADEHTKNYRNSSHYRFLEMEMAGKVARGSGVTCATCHMPKKRSEEGHWYTNHNQNDSLRPNEKMIRATCSQCHGLPFAIDALADADLVKENFSGQPTVRVKSVDYALARE